MYQKTILDNGLRILTETMPHTRSVSVAIFLGAGSRYESEQESGAAHFIEHMLFKGTRGRPNAQEVCQPIEAVGGVLNGGTDKELTIYWSKVASQHFDLALDVLADMVLESKFDPAEMDKERQVIIEEINMSLDSPQSQVGLLIDEVVWPNQPLGWDVAGNKATVSQMSRDNLLDFMGQMYRPRNALVSVAGNIDHEQAVRSIARGLGRWQDAPVRSWSPAKEAQRSPRVKVAARPAEQAHLCLALRGVSYMHPDRFAHDLLNVVLGEGMTSRLFLEIRERRGLVYDIHSYVDHFMDSGVLSIYAGVDPARAELTLEAVLEELKKLKNGVPQPELVKAREFSKGRLQLAMEDSRSVVRWLGAQELLLGRVLTLDEVVAIIDRITAEDLARAASELVRPDRLNMAVVGPGAKSGQFKKLLHL